MATIQKIVRKKVDRSTGKVRLITRYRAFIRHKGRQPITKTFSSKRLAQAFVHRAETDREMQAAYGHSVIRRMTLAALIDEYLTQWQGRDKGTIARLRWWQKRFGEYLLVDFDRLLIREALNDLAKGEARRGHGPGRSIEIGRERSAATVNRYKAALSGALSYACAEYDLRDNPARFIRNRRESRGRIRFLNQDERSNLLISCRESKWDRLYLLVLMAITTGARRSELLGLRWQDIDFRRQRAVILKTKTDIPRVLPLTQNVVSELGRFQDVGAGRIFPATANPWQPFEFEKHWQVALKGAEVLDFRFHDLRHTCASYLAQNGATLVEIGDVLGHTQAQTTLRYAHLCVSKKEALIQRVMENLQEIN